MKNMSHQNASNWALISVALVLAAVAALLAVGDPVRAQTCPGAATPTPTEVTVTAVPIVVDSTTADYFVLYASHQVDEETVWYPVKLVLGDEGTTTLSENVVALPPERYRVEKYSIDYPADVDGDCVDDITEFTDAANKNPLNPAVDQGLPDRFSIIPDHPTFESLALVGHNGLGTVKFVIADMGTDRPSVYFQDTKRFRYHTLLSELGDKPIRGSITYDPDLAARDGSPGVYRYTIEGRASVGLWDRVHTLLAASMPVLDDDLALWITNRKLPQIQAELQSGATFRAHLVFDEDVHGEARFLALHPGEGYGLLRSLEADERPHSRDVVIYETLPNELPRVAGIISTVPQTPLSHVNLRALQDDVPNAFIADALDNADISDLIGSHVYYAVSDTAYSIRAATQAEVDEFYASSRPTEAQTPERDLTVTTITALDDISFDDWDSFGVKAANVAVLGTLGFPAGTVPDGFAVPFYFYDEFMKHNGLYDDIEELLADADFQSDYDTREDELKKLRKKIKKAETPGWIETALTEMHATFPEGTSLRYRSSTNNEDLPGFNGAGLYDSKTQYPEETEEDGISKSLKQVYASLWNYRAFIERDFHRIDHLATAMGVLVHPNYADEPVNGVAVSVDPAYGTEGTHYVNSQRGEDLVTNPEALSEPEELLLYPDGSYTVVELSNQVPPGQLLMTDDQLAQLRRHLAAIHERFADLYAVEEDEQFAMEIEFKITSDNVLAIKQARPWVFSHAPPDLGAEGVALTAEFEDVPASHDGSLFTFRILFSDHISTTFREFEDFAMVVSGGRVTRANRVNSPASDHWVIDVAPSRPLSDITLVLAHNRHCPVVGAICTADGRRLSNRLERKVKAPPPAAPQGLTATALWSGIVDLGWNDVGRADFYEVQFSPPPQGNSEPDQWEELPTSDTAIAFYGAGAVVKNLPPEPFLFRVRAVGSHGVSAWSQHVLVPSTGRPQAWTDVAEPVNSAATGMPTISGTPIVGDTLRADVSAIGDDNGLERVKFRYQWTHSDGADDSDIAGATGQSHVLTPADAGTNIGVRVSFVDRQGFTESVSSDPDGILVNVPAAGEPVIVGTPRVGETLVADTSAISDADGLSGTGFSYQWVREYGTGDADIADATGPSYALGWDDEAWPIKVRVAFSDGAGVQESLISAPTAAVATAAGEVALDGELWASRDSSMVPAMSGYSVFGNLDGTLTPDRFEFGGDTNEVQGLVYSGGGLWLGMKHSLPSDFTLRVGDAVFHGGKSKLLAATLPENGYWWPSAPPDWTGNGPVVVSLTLHPDLPLGDRLKAPLIGSFWRYPTDHDGTQDISFRIHFTDADGVVTTAEELRDHVLRVTGGVVSSVDAVDSSGRIWAISVTPAGWAPVTIRIPADLRCDRAAAICSHDGRRLFNSMELVVPARPNRPPIGIPTISGEVEVGTTLTVDTSGISDPDGMTAATFAYQWVSNNLLRDTDIEGATGPAYTPVPADAGRGIKVRISFRDDAGKTETLTSPARTERPQRLTAAASDGSVVLTWELPQHWGYSDAFFYILRSRPELGEVIPLKRTTHIPRGHTTYTDTDIEPGLLYEYRVRGADPFGTPRDASDPVEIRTPEPVPVENSPATGTPAINGAAQVREALSVDTSGIADADGLVNATFSYQWLADDTDVSGATGSTYTLVAADEGKTVKVRVSFTDDAGHEETLTSPATATVEAKPNTPATGVPTISGTAQVGETLTADTSGISDADELTNATLSYQWLADDADISGATGSTYTLAPADEGKAIKVRVSFTDDGGNDETLTSAATAAVEATPHNHDRPHGLQATAGSDSITLTWQDPDTHKSYGYYRILRHRPELGEADPLVYVDYLATSDRTFVDSGVAPGVLYVYAVKAVKDPFGYLGPASTPVEVRLPPAESPNSPATGAPTITGTVQVGEILTADTSGIVDTDGLTDTTFRYQWLADDDDISGATGSTYTLVAADEGKAIKVRVVFADDGGNEETLTSAATATVVAALTAQFLHTPASHDGQTAFTFELRFSEQISISYKTLRDHAFTVTGGGVTEARRLQRDSDEPNRRWEITIEPSSNASVTIVLPVTEGCADDGAICTEDGRMLANRVELNVTGPGE